MNHADFVNAIAGKRMKFTRTCLATGEITEEADVTPTDPMSYETGSDVKLRRIRYYGEDDLFTFDHGVYVAVENSGASHLFCDRFEPI